MKKIIIKEWLKFLNSNKSENLIVEPAYRVGYWNVMKWNQQLEDFLVMNNIQYSVTEEPLS